MLYSGTGKPISVIRSAILEVVGREPMYTKDILAAIRPVSDNKRSNMVIISQMASKGLLQRAFPARAARGHPRVGSGNNGRGHFQAYTLPSLEAA